MPPYALSRIVDGVPKACGICDACELGDTINLLLSGIVVCTPCLPFPSGTDSVALSNISGLNAAHVLTGLNPIWSLISAGSIDWIHYDTAACTGTPAGSGTSTFTISVTCLDGVLSTFAVFNYTIPAGSFTISVYSGADTPLDTATPNDQLVCLGSSGGGTGGTATPTIP